MDTTAASCSNTVLPPTAITSLQKYLADDAFTSPSDTLHPLSPGSATTVALLQQVVNQTGEISRSLDAHMQAPLSNEKLVSLLRQYALASGAVHQSEGAIHAAISKFSNLIPDQKYGEDVPFEKTQIASWCISRLETWGSAAGMEMFKEETEQGSHVSLLCGGKVIVVDVEFDIADMGASLDISHVKTSFAVTTTGAQTTMHGSPDLDELLAATIRQFLVSACGGDTNPSGLGAARTGRAVKEQLNHLMLLDGLAVETTTNSGDGLKWFLDVQECAEKSKRFTLSETRALLPSLPSSLGSVPLDIFLNRSHAVCMQHLLPPGPSLSFLVHLSPRAYLPLLRASRLTPEDDTGCDIPTTSLRSYLSVHPLPRGAAIATLNLSQLKDTTTLGAPLLLDKGVLPEHAFQTHGGHSWALVFNRKIVMSQSRMRSIHQLLSGDMALDMHFAMDLAMFVRPSWVDLLIHSELPYQVPMVTPLPFERYVGTYRSPTDSHPPVQLRLTAAHEPGYELERLPVRSLQEAYAVLEIVREQCWLNEVLATVKWEPEGMPVTQPNPPDSNTVDEVTEEELQAVLSGNITPISIPVTLMIPGGSHPPQIIMTSPERPPTTGVVNISVSHSTQSSRGVNVQMQGAFGMELSQEIMEELCRRGGALSLPGRVWKASIIV